MYAPITVTKKKILDLVFGKYSRPHLYHNLVVSFGKHRKTYLVELPSHLLKYYLVNQPYYLFIFTKSGICLYGQNRINCTCAYFMKTVKELKDICSLIGKLILTEKKNNFKIPKRYNKEK